MTKPISDMTVLIAGAGRGLGAALARAFAREGARVANNYRHSKAQAHALAAELAPNAMAVQADVTDPAEVARMVADVAATLGAPVVLVHNALADFAFNGEARTPLDRLTWADNARQTETAVGGALNCLHALYPYFQAARFGRIITVGTNLVQNPVVPYHDYTAAEGALLAFTRTAAKELGLLGDIVNMVSGAAPRDQIGRAHV